MLLLLNYKGLAMGRIPVVVGILPLFFEFRFIVPDGTIFSCNKDHLLLEFTLYRKHSAHEG